MKLFDSVGEMFKELRKAKIVSLSEWRDIKRALGSVYFDYQVKKSEAQIKEQIKKDRKEHNDRVVRSHGLNKGNKRD
jgi:hypothetical protein